MINTKEMNSAPLLRNVNLLEASRKFSDTIKKSISFVIEEELADKNEREKRQRESSLKRNEKTDNNDDWITCDEKCEDSKRLRNLLIRRNKRLTRKKFNSTEVLSAVHYFFK